MRYIVCAKQVPDTNEVKIDPKTNTLIREGVPSILNPFDQFALEEAIKMKNEGDEIVAISMGPPQAKKALMKCLALGADRAILLSDRAFAGADTFATAFTLAGAIKKIGKYDVIFTGLQAIDGDTAQVGPEIAAQLGIPQLTYVEEVLKIEGKKLEAKTVTDDGYNILEAKLPVLVAGITPSSFEPSNPAMRAIITAKKKPFETWTAEEIDIDKEHLGLDGSLTQVIKIYPPPVKEKGEIYTDEPEIAVEKMFNKLVDNGVF